MKNILGLELETCKKNKPVPDAENKRTWMGTGIFAGVGCLLPMAGFFFILTSIVALIDGVLALLVFLTGVIFIAFCVVTFRDVARDDIDENRQRYERKKRRADKKREIKSDKIDRLWNEAEELEKRGKHEEAMRKYEEIGKLE